MTRAEQIAAAERVARDNREWQVISGLALRLRRKDTADTLILGRRKVTWAAYAAGHRRLRGPLRALTFRSPAAAIRALGFTLNDESE